MCSHTGASNNVTTIFLKTPLRICKTPPLARPLHNGSIRAVTPIVLRTGRAEEHLQIGAAALTLALALALASSVTVPAKVATSAALGIHGSGVGLGGGTVLLAVADLVADEALAMEAFFEARDPPIHMFTECSGRGAYSTCKKPPPTHP